MDSCFSFDLSTALPGDAVGVEFPWEEHALPNIPAIVGDQFIAYTLPVVSGPGDGYPSGSVGFTGDDTAGGYVISAYSDVSFPWVVNGDGTRRYILTLRFVSPIPFTPGEPLGLTVFTKVSSAPTALPELTGGGPGYVEAEILGGGTSQLTLTLLTYCNAASPITFLVTVVADGESPTPPVFWTSRMGCTESTP